MDEKYSCQTIIHFPAFFLSLDSYRNDSVKLVVRYFVLIWLMTTNSRMKWRNLRAYGLGWQALIFEPSRK